MKMKKDNVKVGQTYAAKVSGNVVPVRLDKVNLRGGWDGVNLRSGKSVRIRSSQRLRGLWPKKTMPIVAEKADDKGVAETVAAVEKGNLAEGVTVPESRRDGNPDGQMASERAMATSVPKAKKGRRAAKATTGKPGHDTGEPGATGAKPERHSLLNLAAKALAEAGRPMTCKEMVDKVLATGLWQTKGRTPSATLYSAVIREVATKGESARFCKVDKGKFAAATK
jgi:hypothetical protein